MIQKSATVGEPLLYRYVDASPGALPLTQGLLTVWDHLAQEHHLTAYSETGRGRAAERLTTCLF